MKLFDKDAFTRNVALTLFSSLCLAIAISKNVAYTLSYGNTNLELTSDAISALAECDRVAPYNNSPREYILAARQLQVFSGFKPLNSLRRYAFYENFLNSERNWPYHHTELYGEAEDYDFRWLGIGGVCKLLSTEPLRDRVPLSETVVERGLQRQLDGPGTQLLYNLLGVNLIESQDLFMYDIEAIPLVYVPKEIAIAADTTEAVKLLRQNSQAVLSGELSIVEADETAEFDTLQDGPLSSLSAPFPGDFGYTDSGFSIDVGDFSGFMAVTLEAFSNTQAYCEGRPKQFLGLYPVNLIQTGIFVPENCKSVVILY